MTASIASVCEAVCGKRQPRSTLAQQDLWKLAPTLASTPGQGERPAGLELFDDSVDLYAHNACYEDALTAHVPCLQAWHPAAEGSSDSGIIFHSSSCSRGGARHADAGGVCSAHGGRCAQLSLD